MCECFALQPSWPSLGLINSFSTGFWKLRLIIILEHNINLEFKLHSLFSNMVDQGNASTVQSQNVSESESFSLYPSSEPTLLLQRLTMLPRLERVVLLKLSFLKQMKLTAVIVLEGEKGIMVAKMRARQSATSLLGAQARAGV